MKGGKISVYPCCSVCKFSIKLMSERSNLAPKPLYTVNLAPAILAALSKSKISRSEPTSQWALCSKSKVLGVPLFWLQHYLPRLSLWGHCGEGVGNVKSASFKSASTWLTSESNFLISSERLFISAINSEVSFPSFFSLGISFESWLPLIFHLLYIG